MVRATGQIDFRGRGACRRPQKMPVSSSFVETALLEGIAPGSAVTVTVENTAVALFNVAGRLFAIDACCLRCGACLAGGTLHEHQVICSSCQWQYDLLTGRVQGLPRLRTDTFDTRIVNSHVLVCKTAKHVPCDDRDDGGAKQQDACPDPDSN